MKRGEILGDFLWKRKGDFVAFFRFLINGRVK